jgi:hypothetical protein
LSDIAPADPSPEPAVAGATGFGGLFHPGGGTTWTMLSHLGQVRMAPMAESSNTLSRARHVVHWIEKSGSTTIGPRAGAREPLSPGQEHPGGPYSGPAILERRRGDVTQADQRKSRSHPPIQGAVLRGGRVPRPAKAAGIPEADAPGRRIWRPDGPLLRTQNSTNSSG